MNTPHDSSLGREVAYPTRYDPALLFPIPRDPARAALGLGGGTLPFTGHDRWHAYELGWLDGRGRPQVATATLLVPAGSPRLVESKSLKLYLNSLNAARFDAPEQVRARVAADLSGCAGAPVEVAFGLPPVDPGPDQSGSLDGIDAQLHPCTAPDPEHLSADPAAIVDEYLHSNLLKSNCPVTGQPDWASVHLRYQGPRIGREGLLRYLVGFRDHAEFHEHCVERIFLDVLQRCAPRSLSVEARYTRRGGLDINPWRATPGMAPPLPLRDPRQ